MEVFMNSDKTTKSIKDNEEELGGSFFINTEQVENGGELRAYIPQNRIFGKQLISLLHPMLDLDLVNIKAALWIMNSAFSEIVSSQEYGLQDAAHYWSYFKMINELFINKPATDDEEARTGYPYLPKTRERAHEIWDAHWSTEMLLNQLLDPSATKWPHETVTRMWEMKTKGSEFLFEWENLKRAFDIDLGTIKILQLDKIEHEFYEQTGNLSFKPKSFTRFHTIERDIKESGKCFATNRYTSCVFHLGRATEIVIQDLATNLGIKLEFPDERSPKRKGRKAWGDLNDDMEYRVGATLSASKIKDQTLRTHIAEVLRLSRKLLKLRNGTNHPTDLQSDFFDDPEEVIKMWELTRQFIEHAAEAFPAPNQQQPSLPTP